MRDSDEDILPYPEKIGSYRILEQLGRGTMGTVYRALAPGAKGEVALKVIPRESDPSRIERFRREALAAARIKGDGIVHIQDWGTTTEHYFCAMEYVRGGSLNDLIKKTPAGARLTLLPCFLKIVEAIAAAHAEDVLHRDLKPSNILITEDGQPKITDFGLAKLMDIEALTAAGTRLGSPYFMAPEQVMGEVDVMGPSTDVFALGVMLFFLLTDRFPFPGKKVSDIFQSIKDKEAEFTWTESRAIPQGLRTIILNALVKEPAGRYKDAGVFAEDLRKWMQGDGIRALPGTRRSLLRPILLTLFVIGSAAAIVFGLRYYVLGHI